jgi:hypothetical protein
MPIGIDQYKMSATFDNSGDTTAVATMGSGRFGWLKTLVVAMPSMSANVSGTATINDEDGYLLYTSTNNIMSAAQTWALTGMEIPMVAGSTVTITLGGIPGSAAGASATPLTATVKASLVT